MQNKETQRINDFELIDDNGNEYTMFEYQEGKQLSLKWIKAGQSWFRLSDGTVVDKVDENTFKVAATDKFLHRRGNSYGRDAAPFAQVAIAT